MSALVRIQFKKRPAPAVLGQLLAIAAMSDDYEDADVIEEDA
jgi:hypothetical protein